MLNLYFESQSISPFPFPKVSPMCNWSEYNMICQFTTDLLIWEPEGISWSEAWWELIVSTDCVVMWGFYPPQSICWLISSPDNNTYAWYVQHGTFTGLLACDDLCQELDGQKLRLMFVRSRGGEAVRCWYVCLPDAHYWWFTPDIVDVSDIRSNRLYRYEWHLLSKWIENWKSYNNLSPRVQLSLLCLRVAGKVEML